MGPMRAAALIVFALTAMAVSGDAPKTPGRIERTADFVARVNGAIDRGVEWLRQQRPDGGQFADFPYHHGGTNALASVRHSVGASSMTRGCGTT